jgi:hypothetical protein
MCVGIERVNRKKKERKKEKEKKCQNSGHHQNSSLVWSSILRLNEVINCMLIERKQTYSMR